MITNILCTSNVYTISITKPLLVFINLFSNFMVNLQHLLTFMELQLLQTHSQKTSKVYLCHP